MTSSPLTLTAASLALSVKPRRSLEFPCQPATSSSRTGNWRSGAAGPLLLTSQLSRRTSPHKALTLPGKKLPDLVLRRSPTQPHIFKPDNEQTVVQSSAGYQSQELAPRPHRSSSVSRGHVIDEWCYSAGLTSYHQETLLSWGTSSVPDPEPTSTGCCVLLEGSTSQRIHVPSGEVLNRQLWLFASFWDQVCGPDYKQRPPFPPSVVSSWVIWCMILLHKSFLRSSTAFGAFCFALCRFYEVDETSIFIWHIQPVRSVWTWSQSQYLLERNGFSWKPKCVCCGDTRETSVQFRRTPKTIFISFLLSVLPFLFLPYYYQPIDISRSLIKPLVN